MPRRPSAPAHPRSRGEHAAREIANLATKGSPPLTRGARLSRRGQPWRSGLTPAHAGSTWMIRRRPLRVRAHPRSRGEHHAVDGLGECAEGSPPLTRGAPTRPAARTTTRGLTPAHAGSTAVSEREHRCPPAHPRSRGEHEQPWLEVPLGAGSPPLTRGAHRPARRRHAALGLTPAHAGSTGRSVIATDPEPAHPRSRGEHLNAAANAAEGTGSPPLTRGAQHRRRVRRVVLGLTPAHAGST